MKQISEFTTKMFTAEVPDFGAFRATFINDKLSEICYSPNSQEDPNIFKSTDPNFYKAILKGLNELSDILIPSADPTAAPNLDTQAIKAEVITNELPTQQM